MKRITRLVAVGALCAMSATAYADGGLRTSFDVNDTEGQTVGTVTLTQQDDGVLVHGTFKDLPAGQHGIHFHTVGTCTPDFEAAGGHYNPTTKQHGFDNPAGAHAGDLPNLEIDDDGTGELSYVSEDITLELDQEGTLYDADGSALIVHANIDDYKTDPSGNSGGRIACGVVTPVEANQLPDTGADMATTWPLMAAAASAIAGGLAFVRRPRTTR